MAKLIMYAGGGDYTTLYGSGFTTCILNSFHMHPSGITWNDTQVIDSAGKPTSDMAALTAIVAGLQKNKIDVLLSIGGGGAFSPNKSLNGEHSVSDVDYMAFTGVYFSDGTMDTALSSANAALAWVSALVTATGANGLDLDPEPMFFTYGQLASATVLLTEWAQSQSLQVTWVPFTAQASWQAYASLLAADGSSPPSWINVQPPAWDEGVTTLSSWASLGAPLVAGFDGGSPDDIQNALAALVNGGTTPAGAYFWNLSDIGSTTPTALATAMTSGLQGTATPKPAGEVAAAV
jgi:hypothetical protein